MERARVRPRSGESRCPFCHDQDVKGNPVIICPGCGAVCHVECVLEVGGCPVMGCGARLVENRTRSGGSTSEAETLNFSRAIVGCFLWVVLESFFMVVTVLTVSIISSLPWWAVELALHGAIALLVWQDWRTTKAAKP